MARFSQTFPDQLLVDAVRSRTSFKRFRHDMTSWDDQWEFLANRSTSLQQRKARYYSLACSFVRTIQSILDSQSWSKHDQERLDDFRSAVDSFLKIKRQQYLNTV